MSCKIIKECRCCGSKNLTQVLDLNEQPLANTYHTGSSELFKYPLVLMLCKDCFHSQLNAVVDPDEMFSNYLYVSGTSKTLHEYFEWFADMVKSETVETGSVLDIACNDGTQLQKFRNLGWKTYGIDPAKNLQELSVKNADKIVVDYLTDSSVQSLGVSSFDAIIAQNVFAHTDDVVGFLNSCKLVMSDSTKLYIQTSQADMIENDQFDTIYHEHLSFFSTRSMLALCNRVNLKLISVRRTSVHGGSYIFVISKQGKQDYSVNFSLDLEEKSGRYSLKRYEQYQKEVNSVIANFKNVVDEYKKQGYLVVGYGAAAKGNTFLNASGVKLHYIIDDNPLKNNLLTPGSDTMIVSKNFIDTLANDVLFVPLAWNFYNEIKSNITKKVSSLPFRDKFSYKIYSYYPKNFIDDIQ
jgi:SAM-dependent methyltransferase